MHLFRPLYRALSNIALHLHRQIKTFHYLSGAFRTLSGPFYPLMGTFYHLRPSVCAGGSHPRSTRALLCMSVTLCKATPFMLCYVAHCYTVAIHIVVFDLSHSLVYVSKPMSSQFANLQSVIFRSCNFHSCKFSYPVASQ